MFKIATLNKIAPAGLNEFDENYTIIDDVNQANGIMVRSQDMLSMEFSPELKAIARAGAGVNNIPLDRCAQSGIVVFNAPGANANAVKELVISTMIMAYRNVDRAILWSQGLKPTEEMDVAKQVEKGKAQFAGREIIGKTLGVVGLGNVGRRIGAAARALGMEVVGYDPFITECEGVEVYSDLKEMVSKAEVITLHLPVNDSTKKMINKDVISCMKDGAVLINYSRDKLVNEDDILEALESRKVMTYVCDFPNDNLVGRDHIILTPHLGASTEEAEDNCAIMAADEIRELLENGNIINSVNFPKLDMGVRGNKVRIAIMMNGPENPIEDVMGLLSAAGANANVVQASKRKDGISYVLVELNEGSPVPEIKAEGQIMSVRVMK